MTYEEYNILYKNGRIINDKYIKILNRPNSLKYTNIEGDIMLCIIQNTDNYSEEKYNINFLIFNNKGKTFIFNSKYYYIIPYMFFKFVEKWGTQYYKGLSNIFKDNIYIEYPYFFDETIKSHPPNILLLESYLYPSKQNTILKNNTHLNYKYGRRILWLG
jgi:hypothetical protein